MEIQNSVYSVEQIKKIIQDYSPVSLNHEKTKETVVIKVPFHKVSVISECTQIIFQLTYDII